MTSYLTPVTYGSVCSGIEAASVAWKSLKWKAEWFSEIEKFPCAVLQHRWPNVPNLGEGCALQPAGKRWANAGVVSGPSRTIAWRVLNAEFFGVPQSRKRVFVMASARQGFDPGTVLFEFPSLPSRSDKYYGKQKKSGTNAYSGIEREFHRYCLSAIPETAGTLLASYNGTSNQDMRMRGGLIVEVTPSLRVRRLTPSECERLQGFPVGHTNIPWRSNSPLPRYKALGNSMPVPVMKWLGERIQQAISST